MPVMIGRRELIAALGSAATWPLAARAQQGGVRIPRIGIIDDAPIWDHFRQGLHDLGYIANRNIAIEYRSAKSDFDRLRQAARELASLPAHATVRPQLARADIRPKEAASHHDPFRQLTLAN